MKILKKIIESFKENPINFIVTLAFFQLIVYLLLIAIILIILMIF